MHEIEELRAPYDFTSQLVGIYPLPPYDARIFSLERDSTLVVRWEGQFNSLESVAANIEVQHRLLDELSDYNIENSGFSPTIAPYKGKDSLFIVTTKVDGPNLQDEVETGNLQAIESAEFLHTSLLKYLNDKIRFGKAYLADIYNMYQYMLAPTERPGLLKPILVDIEANVVPDNLPWRNIWFESGGLCTKHLYQDIAKLSTITHKSYPVQAGAVELAKFMSHRTSYNSSLAEVMIRAYSQGRDISGEENEQLEGG